MRAVISKWFWDEVYKATETPRGEPKSWIIILAFIFGIADLVAWGIGFVILLAIAFGNVNVGYKDSLQDEAISRGYGAINEHTQKFQWFDEGKSGLTHVNN